MCATLLPCTRPQRNHAALQNVSAPKARKTRGSIALYRLAPLLVPSSTTPSTHMRFTAAIFALLAMAATLVAASPVADPGPEA